jgi:hypothetical protein
MEAGSPFLEESGRGHISNHGEVGGSYLRGYLRVYLSVGKAFLPPIEMWDWEELHSACP